MAALKANPNRPALGTIVEAEMDKAKGPLATVLVQKGTLTVGDYVVVGPIYGKIKAMFNDKGKALRKAPPSTPASILGLSDVPQSGDILRAVPDEKTARELADLEREQLDRAAAGTSNPTIDLERLSSMIAAGALKELDIVLKADVQGSLEPIVNSLNKLGDEKENIKVRLLHQATGMITESDVTLAAAANSTAASKAAMVIGFNVEPDSAAKRTAEMQGVEIRTFKIIYELVDAIDLALRGLYEPKYHEVVDGHAEVRQVFKLGKSAAIAGSIVNDGSLTRGASVRVRRNDKVIFEGKLSSLRRFKDDVKDVSAGFECGITLDGFTEVQEKDIIETYHKERMN
jgi:translation initiation factor IF-2